MSEGLAQACNIAFLGDASPPDETLLQVSPARLADEHTPPMFIWATYEDGLVPPAQSLLMASALAEKKIPFEIHIFESGPHGLSLATQASSGSLGQIDKDAAKWIGLCGAWLNKRLAFELI